MTGQWAVMETLAPQDFLAFRDIDPKAPVHVLLVPRKPIPRTTRLIAAARRNVPTASSKGKGRCTMEIIRKDAHA